MRRRTAMLFAVLGLALGGCLPGGPAPAPVRPSGPPTFTVPASIDASGRYDVTKKLNGYLASVPDGAILRFARNGRYRIDDRFVIKNRSNLEIDGNGATLFARTDGYATRSHVRIEDSSHITIHDLTVRGANPHAGTGDAAYVPSREHQHAFDARSVDTLVLQRVKAYDVYGDFVYLGNLPKAAWTSHVTIRDSQFARNGRQGIAIIAARDVLIEDNSISDVRRATFDFEPRAAGEGVDGVTVRDNTIGAGKLMFVAADGSGVVHHVTVSRNTLHGQALQVYVHNNYAGYRTGWTVTGNTSDLTLSNPHASAMRIWRVNGLRVTGNRQPFKANRNMVLADITDTCGITLSGNATPGSVGPMRVHGSCTVGARRR
jgi:hypothetical protein